MISQDLPPCYLHDESGILLSFEDYLQLVDYTGRCARDGKRGAISAALPPSLHDFLFITICVTDCFISKQREEINFLFRRSVHVYSF